MTSQLYGNQFYADQSASSERSASVVMSLVWKEFGPFKSVVDVGGGVGTWLKAAASCGASITTLIEGPWVKDQRLVWEPNASLFQDLENSLPNVGKHDLAMCLEVAEHLSPNRANGLVKDLVSLSDTILFSAAIPGQTGTGHINERWLSYWVDMFLAHGYGLHDTLRSQMWADTRVEWWYRQNVVVFRTSADHTRKCVDSIVDIVHPEALLMYSGVTKSSSNNKSFSNVVIGNRTRRSMMRYVLNAFKQAARRVIRVS